MPHDLVPISPHYPPSVLNIVHHWYSICEGCCCRRSNIPGEDPKKGHKHAKVADLATERAVNAKQYLVTEKGVDASRVSVATGSKDGKMVENYLVPLGGDFAADVTGTHPGEWNRGEAAGAQALGARPVGSLWIGLAASEPHHALSARVRERARHIGWKLA